MVSKTPHPRFWECLRRLRVAAGFKTQHDLDRACGFGLSTVAQYENQLREPGLENLDTLCDVLKCSADALLGRAKPKRAG